MSRIHEALQRARGKSALHPGTRGQAAASGTGESLIDQYEREESVAGAREFEPSVDYPQENGGSVVRGLRPTTGFPPQAQGQTVRAIPPASEPWRTTEALRDGGQPQRGDDVASDVDVVADTEARGLELPRIAGVAPMIAPSGPHPIGAEQYRRLAAELHELQITRGLSTVMVTSALPQDGKTLTAVNLALALSGSYDRRVLLIDADMRRPSIHTLLEIPKGRGLSDVLRDSQRELPIVEVSPRLSVLPAGRTVADPLAGLSSERMPRLLEGCASRFDWVVLDTPPVGPTPDAQLLAQVIRAVIFVIRAGATPFPMVERAIADIGRESIVGTVLNDVDAHRIDTGYDYYDQYRSAPGTL